MTADTHTNLSRRERQIVDALYAQQEATAAQVQEALPGSPSYSTVRALLKKLLDKGHVQFRADGPRYVYSVVLAKSDARRGAMRRLLDIFFNGSPVAAVANLLGDDQRKLTDSDLQELEDLVARLKSDRAAEDPASVDEQSDRRDA